jgi:DNA polymerase-4
MQKWQLQTCADLQALSLSDLQHHFGQFGERLYDLCRGIDHSSVKPHRQRKSISVETTFSQDLSLWLEVRQHAEKLFAELQLRMAKAKIEPENLKSLQVKVKTQEFKIFSKDRAIPFSKDHFLQSLEEHFYQVGEPIRLLGLGGKLDVKVPRRTRGQLTLF